MDEYIVIPNTPKATRNLGKISADDKFFKAALERQRGFPKNEITTTKDSEN